MGLSIAVGCFQGSGHRAASLQTLRFRLSGSGVSAQRLAIRTPGLSLEVCISGAEGSGVQDLCG